ncbi:MAG TPA: hypothetical protein VNW92_28705, partial [Polyangiaceae bacterium]|nr:hypothetical protein [Polyangiaceae bacterium]
AKVDTNCTPPAGMDCYGVTWGAAIGMNLNQPIDPTTMMGVVKPLPYDASALTGFAFDISGSTVPTAANFRFKVEDANGEYCTAPAKGIKLGPNVYKFTDLVSMCWAATATSPNATVAQKGLLKISWQVVTNSSSAVPFDFCVSNIRALQ